MLEGYTASAEVTEGVMPGHDMTVRVTYTEAVPAPLIGDVNNDGEVNFADVTFLYMYLLGLGDVDEQGRLNADIDGSGQIDFIDVTMLYSMLLMG